MKKDKKQSIEENLELPAEESVETASVQEEPVDVDVAPAAHPFVESDPLPAEEASEAAASSEEPAAPASASAEAPAEAGEQPAPAARADKGAAPTGYGAPQMLYEDFIPYEYLHDTPEEQHEAPAEPAPDDAGTEEKKKKKEKEKKPSKEEQAILAAVEAEMASRSASAPTEPAAPAPAPAREPEVAPVVPVAPVSEAPQEVAMTEEKKETASTPREYTSLEKKLRKKYAMDNDAILSQNDVVPGFVLAKGEHLVRCYYCLDSSDGEGTLCLTNKRLLVNSDERSEVEVDRVTGIKFMKRLTLSVVKLIFAIIFFVIGAALIATPFLLTMDSPVAEMIALFWKDWMRYLFFGLGGLNVVISLPFWFTMIKKYFRFNILVKDSASFLECKSPTFFKKEKKGKMSGTFILAKAGKESEKAARELGALLIEIKAGRYDF